jgi:hypothetical protein
MAPRLVALVAFSLLAALLGSPRSAQAKDICVQDTPGASWVFQKVKKFKTGRVVPLAGLYVSGGETFPLHGSAVLRPSGIVELGVLVHAMSGSIFTGHNLTASMQLDTGLEGTGGLDTDGDYLVNSATYGWVAVDCSTLTIP